MYPQQPQQQQPQPVPMPFILATIEPPNNISYQYIGFVKAQRDSPMMGQEKVDEVIGEIQQRALRAGANAVYGIRLVFNHTNRGVVTVAIGTAIRITGMQVQQP